MNTKFDYSVERQDVWYELSDLFLDTELDDADLQRMARILAASSFTTGELNSILQDEVAPILHQNLLCVAGQWGMFDREEEVTKPIISRLQALDGKPARGWFPFLALRRWFQTVNVQPVWKTVLSEVQSIRKEH